ncbi:isorenieratene synthase [Friedmanniella endophytica]|uniref:Isorenieratene synthase n=1 Tax=Microlunatus kandeliicorticis TaxID=1759536 RepID=A0A7W3ITC5_9ACTN|nr:FAD-dependent oxidoreductase [Microlunatus kandeliicorticis]MBA8794871.1 isorenieratene synthase [Microlunatus kandeliicorticis]
MSARTRAGWRPGRDPRAVRHPGPFAAGDGRRSAGRSRHVVVVGGGIAGLAAATALAEAGVAVTVLEREHQLGGRVGAWSVDTAPGEPPRTMSRGFHAFFRQYYNLRALLRRTDPALERLVPVEDYPLTSSAGYTDSFTGIPRTPPLNLISFVAQSPSFTARDLARVDVGAALELLDVDFPATFGRYDGESAAAFLDRLRFPPAARHLALEVFARSFFADPREFSAGELVAMFHTYFLGSAEGLLFDVPDDDYDTALWAPLGRYLAGLGVRVRTGTTATSIAFRGDPAGEPDGPAGAVVELDGGERIEADAVVLAADPVTTQTLAAGATGVRAGARPDAVDDWHDRLERLRPAPPFAVWRRWLDRPVAASRPPFVGTSGFGPLDNVTVLQRFEAGARRWVSETGGAVVELHAYAAPVGDGSEAAIAALRDSMWTEAARVYPELAETRALAEEWLLLGDCPMIGTEPWVSRPGVSTPDPRLLLAGDGIRCELPVALMERAATTGFQAANTLLAGWGRPGQDLWSVPTGARHRVSAPLRRAMDRTRRVRTRSVTG